MPFLRVIRDRRGYETTYLMHWYRESSRQQHARILYVFRSPGGLRVGREPLEPEVLRQIEAQHPDISFDWKIVRENQQVVDVAPEPRRRRPPRAEEPAAAPVAVVSPPSTPQRPAVPATIEGETPDAQIEFLTRTYASVRERIVQRIPDPARQEALIALAERLNPAAWTDADQITTGLQEAAEALDRLSHVFRRRRRARKKGRTEVTDGAGATGAATSLPDAEESIAEDASSEEGEGSSF